MILRKIAILAVLVVAGLVYLGWLPRERANRFIRFTVGIFLLGFAVRVGGWLLAQP